MKGIYMEKEDAVSPVIATILMVAITVVLAATVYILVSHYTTGASTPLAATITEQSETSTTATLSLSFTSPASLSNPTGLTFNVGGSSLTFYSTGELWDHSAVAIASYTGYAITITNPDGTSVVSGTAISSGATITITYYSSGTATSTTWSGVSVSLTYTGYTGSASTTLP